MLEYYLSKLDPDPDSILKWGLAGEGAKRPIGGRVWEGGIPLLDQGVFALWGFKLSDLVHTLGKFVGILSIQTRSKSRSLLEVGDGQ